MFDPTKDERLKLVQHKAAATAFYSMWIVVFLMMVLWQVTEIAPLRDPAFTLFIPWIVGTMAFVIAAWSGGIYSTMRDESTRSRAALKESRLRFIIMVSLFAVVMFLIRRSGVFSHDPSTLQDDLVTTLVVTSVVGMTWWFLIVRRKKNTDDDV
ncbi:MAG: hypothetical protein IH600_07985 [Bacteroidetes bacterium]|nr:hypothetical protein [Bacteroidota bacterium]